MLKEISLGNKPLYTNDYYPENEELVNYENGIKGLWAAGSEERFIVPGTNRLATSLSQARRWWYYIHWFTRGDQLPFIFDIE